MLLALSAEWLARPAGVPSPASAEKQKRKQRPRIDKKAWAWALRRPGGPAVGSSLTAAGCPAEGGAGLEASPLCTPEPCAQAGSCASAQRKGRDFLLQTKASCGRAVALLPRCSYEGFCTWLPPLMLKQHWQGWARSGPEKLSD